MRIILVLGNGRTDDGVRLHNRTVEVIGGRRRGEEIPDHIPTRRLAGNGDLVLISSEARCDLVDIFERHNYVQHAEVLVRAEGSRREIAQDTEAVLNNDDDRIGGLCKIGTIQTRVTGGANAIRTAVNPHKNRKIAPKVGGSRGVDVEV